MGMLNKINQDDLINKSDLFDAAKKKSEDSLKNNIVGNIFGTKESRSMEKAAAALNVSKATEQASAFGKTASVAAKTGGDAAKIGGDLAGAASSVASGASAASGVLDVVNSTKGNGSTSSAAGAGKGVISAMSTAASMGLVDPISQSVAAVVGATAGLIGAAAARKKEGARIESEKISKLGEIEGQSGRDQSNLLMRLGQNMRIT